MNPRESNPSGNLTPRVPVDLHALLIEEAAAQGVSLNQFVVAVLAGAVGYRAGGDVKVD